MKNLKYIVGFSLIMLLLSMGHGYCGKDDIVDEDNLYGGKTEEKVYKKGKKLESGIWKIIKYYDSNDQIRAVDSYYTEERAKEDGVVRRGQYYNYNNGVAVLTKAEFYYGDDYIAYNGIYKVEENYYDNGNKKSSECFFAEKWSKKKVVSRMLIDYDSRGLEKVRIYYDSKGNVLSREEK